ncbi:hypothetical protein CLV37_101555 [Kineococcus rhizosphaerae]|uniref:Uncharacterized protein n=1 Tax=Kineococcus rhizosphaerae TaxID=559628 RepID=A0A2T0RAZ5_9ACTN|nr:hypothetical protein CLV37_101555 [Kineococcus rhizosphaerae]
MSWTAPGSRTWSRPLTTSPRTTRPFAANPGTSIAATSDDPPAPSTVSTVCAANSLQTRAFDARSTPSSSTGRWNRALGSPSTDAAWPLLRTAVGSASRRVRSTEPTRGLECSIESRRSQCRRSAGWLRRHHREHDDRPAHRRGDRDERAALERFRVLRDEGPGGALVGATRHVGGGPARLDDPPVRLRPSTPEESTSSGPWLIAATLTTIVQTGSPAPPAKVPRHIPLGAHRARPPPPGPGRRPLVPTPVESCPCSRWSLP